MNLLPTAIKDLNIQPFNVYGNEGALLLSGTGIENCNTMTISWGTFGIMWGKPVVMVMVRPTRHTWTFINEATDFTVNWLPDEKKDALRVCGSKSGRDIDKFRECGITPVKSQSVESPIIAESILTLECRIIYRDNLKPENFIDRNIINFYAANDFHGLFYGEVTAAAVGK